ncbi:MAG TPA: M23 family metallopeptidase [Fervidobacterium sp.]|nr:M23 family metallopeptidase [Fervidobacterium sp.]
MRRYSIVVFLVVLCISVFSSYIPPVDNSYVTATFLEFRSTGNVPHYHSGTDFSTFLKEGIPVKAANNGYLARLEIDEGGIYGNTVVLQHDDGYKSIYAHLSRFAEKTDKIVNMLTSEFGKQRIVVEFQSDDIVFSQGEVIGYSGKTGEASQAHAHFEIRDREEKNAYDPLDFIDKSLLRPVQMGVMIKNIVIDGKEYTYQPGGVYTFSGDFPKISVEAYTELAKNLLGVKEVKVYFSDNLVYHIILDRLPMDYWQKPYDLYDEKTVMTSLIYRGYYKLYSSSDLPFVKVNKLNDYNHSSQYSVSIEIRDTFGNVGTFPFKLVRG